MTGGAFGGATAVQHVGEGRYLADLDETWSIEGRPNGGYLLAVVARAAIDATRRPHPLAVSGHFLAPPAPGPAEIHVDVVRAGRSVSTAHARLVQDGRPQVETVVTVGELADDVPDWSAESPPSMPPPEECLGGQPPNQHVPLLQHVDVRLDPATAPLRRRGPTGVPELRAWLRFHDGAEGDVLALPLITDLLPPTVFNLGMYGWAPTVELTFLLRGLPAPGWVACRSSTRLVAGGWFDEEAAVWSADGRLLGQSRQLARVGRG